MTTMREVVSDAMEEIGVKTAEIALQSDELQAGIRRCNDMLLEWSDLGITPGYIEVLNGDDVLNVDRNAIRAIKKNLAVDCAPSFQKVVTQLLLLTARDTKSALETSSVHIGPVRFPDTLPLGSGNECGDFYDDTRFFPQNKTENF
jgi:hypothetical protein